MCALVQALRRVPINGPGGGGDPLGSANNATYSVAIPDSVAAKNAADAAAAKEAKRLVPPKTADARNDGLSSPVRTRSNGDQLPLGLSVAQDKAIDDLTSRDPASDPARDEAWTSSREDSITLGERPSIDRQDLEDVRGLLRRESTKGKRKPGTEQRMMSPNVPTIQEPQPPIGWTDYAQQGEAPTSVDDYENYRMQQQAGPSTPQQMSGNAFAGQGQNVEMRQMSRSPSNPYRQRSESTAARKPSNNATGRPWQPGQTYEEV